MNIKKFFSLCFVLISLLSILHPAKITVSAASTGKVTCIKYISEFGKNHGKSTYITRYYTVKRNKKVTLQGYWSDGKLKNQTSIGMNGRKLKDLLRFDVHIINKKTGKVVNYWYCLKTGDTFKVFSSVPNVNEKEYTVKVTSYLTTYRTEVNSNLAGVASNLKYQLIY